MKTTKWILACVLVVSMTAATIWAQKDATKDAPPRHNQSL